MSETKTNLSKNKQGYGYKYTELAQINEYLESEGIKYYQYIDTAENGYDYIYTVPIIDGKELPPRKGCKIVEGSLQGKSNPAQEQGSSITYARRYSLLLAFGLATEDNDAENLDGKKEEKPKPIMATKKQLVEIKELVKDIPAMLEYFKIEKIEDMTKKQAESIINNKKQKKEKEGE